MSRDRRGRRPERDPFSDPDWKAFAAQASHDMIPKVLGSAICMSLVPDNPRDIDVKYCMELGAMVLLDKPIIAVHGPGCQVPEKLRAVADLIVEVDWKQPDAAKLVHDAIGQFVREHGITGDDFEDAT